LYFIHCWIPKLSDNIENQISLKKIKIIDIQSYINHTKQALESFGKLWFKQEDIVLLVKEIIFYYNIWVLKEVKFKNKEEKKQFENQLLQTLKSEFKF